MKALSTQMTRYAHSAEKFQFGAIVPEHPQQRKLNQGLNELPAGNYTNSDLTEALKAKTGIRNLTGQHADIAAASSKRPAVIHTTVERDVDTWKDDRYTLL